MTTLELNRDIKRLCKAFKEYWINKDMSNWTAKEIIDYDKKILDLRKEYIRLYDADPEFLYMSKQSIRIMIRVNLSIRAVPLHLFGIKIEV